MMLTCRIVFSSFSTQLLFRDSKRFSSWMTLPKIGFEAKNCAALYEDPSGKSPMTPTL